MKRPTPLPQPPARTAKAAPPARDGSPESITSEETWVPTAPPHAADASRGASGRVGPAAATAPVIPLATGPVGTEPAPADGAVPGERVGLRDVWSASRARRKALRAEVRRFTVRQRRRRSLWIGVAASLLVVTAATVGAAYSPLFAVETLTIAGVQQLDEAQVREALSDQLGTPMPLVDESAVKAALVGFPLVESYTLEARPPHELVVRIVERTPVGVIETRAGYTLVDAAGVALSTSATPAAGTPVLDIRGGVDSDAFLAAGQVLHSLPESVRAQVTGVTASTPDDVTLTLGDANAQVVWGSAEDSAQKALNLEKIMASRPPSTVSVYDVSSPGAVVVR